MQKNFGEKFFSKEAEASTAIKAHVEQDNPGISNLEVKVEDGILLNHATSVTTCMNSVSNVSTRFQGIHSSGLVVNPDE